MKYYSGDWSNELKKLITESQSEAYTMTMVGEDIDTIMMAVNQGIDGHLEACYVPERGDSYTHDDSLWVNRLNCIISMESLTVLVRRLLERDDDSAAQFLAYDICNTLDIELS